MRSPLQVFYSYGGYNEQQRIDMVFHERLAPQDAQSFAVRGISDTVRREHVNLDRDRWAVEDPLGDVEKAKDAGRDPRDRDAERAGRPRRSAPRQQAARAERQGAVVSTMELDEGKMGKKDIGLDAGFDDEGDLYGGLVGDSGGGFGFGQYGRDRPIGHGAAPAAATAPAAAVAAWQRRGWAGPQAVTTLLAYPGRSAVPGSHRVRAGAVRRQRGRPAPQLRQGRTSHDQRRGACVAPEGARATERRVSLG